jgi:tetratricopeptide (TPR) repeat protein
MKNCVSKSNWIILPIVLFLLLSNAFARQEQIKSENAESYLNRGLADHAKGQYDQAISDYTKALEISPGDAGTYYARRFTYYFKKEYEKSLVDVKKAQSLGYPIHPKFLDDLLDASGKPGRRKSGAPRAKPVAPNERPSGATSRPRAGAFIHGQRPWLSAAGVKHFLPVNFQPAQHTHFLP